MLLKLSMVPLLSVSLVSSSTASILVFLKMKSLPPRELTVFQVVSASKRLSPCCPIPASGRRVFRVSIKETSRLSKTRLVLKFQMR